MYSSEKEMSINFEKFIQQKFGNSYLKECAGLFGIPDFVIYDNQNKDTLIYSFELKLSNWKRATIQAFKYRSFADISYVVMSKLSSKNLNKKIEYCKHYNLGLAIFDEDSNFEILNKPQTYEPYSENLNSKLISTIKNSKKIAKNLDVLVAN